jgi:hypothetical protein
METIDQAQCLPEKIKFDDYYNEADMVVLAEDGHGKFDEEILTFVDQFQDVISTLFIELSVTLQPSIDAYIETGKITDDLDKHFSGCAKEGKDLKDGTLKLFDRAKEYGIEIVCYDASKKQTEQFPTRAREGYYFIKGESRDYDMTRNVTEHGNSRGKSLVIIGAGHTNGSKDATGLDRFGERIKEKLGDKCLILKLTESDTEPEPLYKGSIIKFKDSIQKTSL